MDNKKIHITAEWLLNATVPVSVILIGVGGTGSYLLEHLADISYALKELDHPGLYVTAYDPKEVNEVSVVRQNFTKVSLGDNKACAMIGKVNRKYGTNWEAVPDYFDFNASANIVITCVDEVSPRVKFAKQLDKARKKNVFGQNEDAFYYWLDTGNGKDYGQAVLGGRELRHIMDIVPNLEEHEDKNEPSCSAMETLRHQDPFINKEIAIKGGRLIWDLFRNPKAKKHGFFVNLKSGNTRPLKIV